MRQLNDNKKIAELFSIRGDYCFTYLNMNKGLFEIGLVAKSSETSDGYIPWLNDNGQPSNAQEIMYAKVLGFNEEEIVKSILLPQIYNKDKETISHINKMLFDNHILSIKKNSPIPKSLFSFKQLKDNFPDLYHEKLEKSTTQSYVNIESRILYW